MGNELQRRNLDFYERQRPIAQRQTCAAVSAIQEAACGYVGARFAGRAGAVFAAELCRGASRYYQVCERVFDYISPPPQGVRYARPQPYMPFVSQQRRLPPGPLTRVIRLVQQRYGLVSQLSPQSQQQQRRQEAETDPSQSPALPRRQRGFTFPFQFPLNFHVSSIVPVAVGVISIGGGGGTSFGVGQAGFGSSIGVPGIGIGGVF